jgi:hypothetical protein
MALIDEPKIRGEDGEIVVPVDQTFHRHRDPDSISELREGQPSDPRKDTADVEPRVTDCMSDVLEVRLCRIRDDGLPNLLDESIVVGPGR